MAVNVSEPCSGQDWLHASLLCINPLTDDKLLDWSKLKQIADDILKCIQNEK